MTLVAFSTHTPFGSAMQMLAATTNAPNIQSSVAQGNDLYSWKLNPVAGNDVTFLRLSSRASATGIQSVLALSVAYMQFWVRFDSFPTDEEFAVTEDGASVFTSSLRIRTDGKVRFHDYPALTSGTAKATGAVALSTATWYRFRWKYDLTGSTTEVLIYNESGTLVDTITATSVNYNASVFGRLFLGWQISQTVLADAQTWRNDAAASFTWYYGSALIDNAAYPHANARVGVQMASAIGTHDAWSLGAGASKVAAVNTIPPDGNTGYLVSTTANAAQTFTLQTCAAAGMSISSILGVSPFWAGWDVGGAVTLGCRFIENSTTTDLTKSDPAATVDFHLRGPIYASTYPSGAALTEARLNAIEVGVVRDAGTVEVRVGSIGQHVIYVPTAPAVTSGSASSITTVAATLAGNVTSDGGATVTERGIAYGTSANPTTSGSKVVVSGTTGAFTGDVSGLSPSTTYHYRAYATNAIGTTYGNDSTFTTLSSGNPPHQQRGITTPRFRGSLAVR